MQSPTGLIAVPSVGPLDAELLIVGESPAKEECKLGEPFVGKSGLMVNKVFASAGIDRSRARIMNLVPVRAPHDKFDEHDPADVLWARELFRQELKQLKNLKIVLALGANPTSWMLGGKPPVLRGDGFISQWRGSVIKVGLLRQLPQRPEDYISRLTLEPPKELKDSVLIVPTYHPAAVNRQFDYHPWLLRDAQLVAKLLREGYTPPPSRQWFYNQPSALANLADVDIISVDTEMEPYIVGIATEDEVHVFEWSTEARHYLEPILTSPKVLKVAHNWSHDHAFIRSRLGIDVVRPLYDTMGGAAILNSALPKELSPHISTRFTTWPYHKWLDNYDRLTYCGIDAIVSYDAYWPQIDELASRDLIKVSEHDHKLLTPLMEMQAFGFRIDESARVGIEQELSAELDTQVEKVRQLAKPIIDKKYEKFEKPHLFKRERRCKCCGGGKNQAVHCQGCWENSIAWGKVEKLTKEIATTAGFRSIKALKESFPPCSICNATGKVIADLEFNPDSPDQVADVIYRGLGIRPRRFKRQETVKAAQLDAIRDRHPLIAEIVETSKLRAELDTVERLRPGLDSRLHCVFDPWGTGSGRIAGKEGLVEPGTNPMNLPIAARRFVIADPGFVLLYPDMAQIEARAVALLSNDKNLIKAFTEPINWPGNPKHGKVDSHTKVVQLMDEAGVEISRDGAKRLTYAGMYGGRAPQVAKELNAEAYRKGSSLRYTDEQVEHMLTTFFQVFSGIRQWHKNVLEEVLRTRRLRCPFTGRERSWIGRIVDSKKHDIDYETAKEIWSYLPQWMGSYVLGRGLIELYYNSGEWGKLVMPLVHVHDALLMQAPIDKSAEAQVVALKYMSRNEWGMWFPAEMKLGNNWYEASV